jgi:predicted patatin/cPLA2 family phospholipase
LAREKSIIVLLALFDEGAGGMDTRILSSKGVVAVGVGLAMLAVAGCGTVPERNPLPQTDGELASIPNLSSEARFWGDEVPDFWLEQMRTWTKEDIQAEMSAWIGGKHSYLAISGGGQDGAFGAGLLNGWTASGTRPEFLFVTGISTGALTAPFAFLGPDYDDELREVYTTLETEDLVEQRAWSVIATSDAALDTDKLRAVIANYVDEEMVRRLAEEHARGRRLFIGTTFLDAGRPVIWSITFIAASDYPDKTKLIGDILLASASIPGAFPPLLIEVEQGGERYDELHVDGGAASQVFVYPSAFDFSEILDRLEVTEPHRIYVIRNSKLAPDWKPIDPNIFEITATSISSLIRTQGMGDLNQIYLLAQRDGGEYRLAYVPEDFDVQPAEPFDKTYMNALYDLGYEMARNGYPWDTLPPAARTVEIE